MPRSSGPPDGREARRARIVRNGPVLVDGPVEVEMEDGTTVRSDRFVVALCTCRRSHCYPFCDTSHRRRVRTDGAKDARGDGGQDARGDGPKDARAGARDGTG